MPSPFFHIPDPAYNRCVQIAQNAINQWKSLVITVAAENIAMGITQTGKTKLIADTLAPVAMYGNAGSLWEAYNALNDIKITPEMAPYITQARIDWMRNELIQIISSL
jgi:hypothetical protein